MGTYIKDSKQRMACCGSCDLSHDTDEESAIVRGPARSRAVSMPSFGLVGGQGHSAAPAPAQDSLEVVFGQELVVY